MQMSTKTQVRALRSDRTVVRLQRVHAFANAVEHKHAMLSCNAKHKLKTQQEMSAAVGQLTGLRPAATATGPSKPALQSKTPSAQLNACTDPAAVATTSASTRALLVGKVAVAVTLLPALKDHCTSPFELECDVTWPRNDAARQMRRRMRSWGRSCCVLPLHELDASK